MENRVWYLRQNALFERVAEDDISRFSQSFSQIVYPKRTLVFDFGDPSANIFLLKTGKVSVSRITADGKEVTLAILGEGDIFGEEALFGKTTRTTVARCMEDSLLCCTRAQDLFKILSVNPILALNVAKYLGERLDDAHNTVEDISSLKVGERILNLFERLANDHGRSTPEGTVLDIRLTHAEIASLIGSSRETVTLEIRRLCDAGRVRVSEHVFILPHATVRTP
ncbi:MAG: Crp/Fnr family transcriptional regulator [Vulcanimicrobiaceae bacterium]